MGVAHSGRVVSGGAVDKPSVTVTSGIAGGVSALGVPVFGTSYVARDGTILGTSAMAPTSIV